MCIRDSGTIDSGRTDTLSIADHTITATGTDDSTNTGTCTFTVTVEDTRSPTIACPEDLADVQATEPSGAEVTWNAAVATDVGAVSAVDTDVAVTYSSSADDGVSSGDTLSIADHTITAPGTDDSDNTVTCTFDVKVKDTQAPTFSCPYNMADVEATAPYGATVSWYAA